MGLKGVADHFRNGTALVRLRHGRVWRTLQDAGTAKGCEGNHSVRRLNYLWAEMPSCSTYLEVGVQTGSTLNCVRVPFKWGVDPYPQFRVTPAPPGVRVSNLASDDFFRSLPVQQRFDLIFLDGLHEWRQTYRDLMHALNHASPASLVLIDDVYPVDELSATPVPESPEEMSGYYAHRAKVYPSDSSWHGDVYKVLLAVHDHHPELDFRMIGRHVAGDNPQAILWRRGGDGRRYETNPMPAWIDEYEAIAFEEVFDGGLPPKQFNWVSEDEGLRAALQGSVGD